jgi:hypothetical protein
MSTVRKRKNMLRKLNNYFLARGKVLTEREYKEASDVPFRLVIIKKYIGTWPRMINFLCFYYPGWRDTIVEEAPVETPTIDLDALNYDE